MSLKITNTNRTLRHVLMVHSATVLLIVAAILGFAGIPPWQNPMLSGVLIAILVALGGSFALHRSLYSLLQIETRLARIASEASAAQDTASLSLEPASGNTPAEFGWNRLVEAGRVWRALDELQKTLLASMADRRRGTGPQLLDSLSEGVATIDAEGKITYANMSLAAMCGQPNGEPLIGQTLANAFGADNDTAAKLSGEIDPAQTSFEWTVPSGSIERVFRGHRRPGRKSDGGAISYVWTIRDITQQKLADSMRDKFLATATHEFRTPLANIRAYAESLDMSDDLDPESRKRFYNVIQSESMRLAQLVDDLLDISKMQAGAMALECRETDLGRLVEEISQKVEGEMREKHLEYRCELPPKYPKLMLDKGKLAAAIVNLLGNAAKYTPEGGRVTFRVDVNSNRVEFSVTDTGIGISEEDLPRVFERFYRCNDDRVREITGSGLGLSLTQEVARLHGGDVNVQSKLNEGSTFSISLPLDSTAA
ncbi:MAG: PAS domain-containing protein [Planctomycetaceae bacterium]|nr:PAS domain-containing protein [Planctomycetaceae bacterium]